MCFCALSRLYKAPFVTHHFVVARRWPATRLGGCEDKKYSITSERHTLVLAFAAVVVGYSTTNVLACPLRGTNFPHDNSLLYDCDPSTLTKALSASYNIIYVPIERVGDDIKISVHILHTKKQIPWPWGIVVSPNPNSIKFPPLSECVK